MCSSYSFFFWIVYIREKSSNVFTFEVTASLDLYLVVRLRSFYYFSMKKQHNLNTVLLAARLWYGIWRVYTYWTQYFTLGTVFLLSFPREYYEIRTNLRSLYNGKWKDSGSIFFDWFLCFFSFLSVIIGKK